MYLTGFADEAAPDLAGQIAATKELGWSWIESRKIDGTMIHDLDDAAFDQVVEQLQGSGVGINCFGSAVANWGQSINDPVEKTVEQTTTCIERMQKVGCKLIRVMSYKVEHDAPSYSDDDQLAEARFERMRLFTKMFNDAGITPVHENCMNYGGMGPRQTLRMIENVPGLKLVFDTGNPVFTPIYDDGGKDAPKQSAWDFYRQVKGHVAYVHIKDGHFEGDKTFCWPGDGVGDVKKIVKDLLDSGYDGGFSMEPHMKVVFDRESGVATEAEAIAGNYVEYGKRFMALLEELGHPIDLSAQGDGTAHSI